MCAQKDQDLAAAASLDVLREALAGKYLLKREIGRGASAHVYLADDLKHDRPVAVKVLRAEIVGRVGVERFLREIRIEARLQHPNIIPLYDSGEAERVPYCVMPFIEGETLRKRIRREQQLSVADALMITRDVASALAFAHGAGIVHRDVKPENILLAGDRALVADFGIARAMAAGEVKLTEDGLAVGTPVYMSPEQASARGEVDARSDVYSLACVVYEMFAGEPPFTGRNPQSVILRHLHDRHTPLATIRPSVPPHVSDAIDVALSKVPADRFPTALDFSRALEGAGGSFGTKAVPGPRAGRWLPIAFAAAAGALGTWWVAQRPPPAEPNRIVVFPLRDRGDTAGITETGDDVATYIGHVLEGTNPLKWEEGRALVPAGGPPATDLPAEQAARLVRARGARYYVNGSVLHAADSVTTVLQLIDVQGDSLVKRAGRSGVRGTSAARLGALAVADLLPSLIEPGRKVDIGGLGERRPSAITAFLQGERAYRRMRFPEALEFYRAAVEDDSLFALAAVKGASAAFWMDLPEDAEELTQLAERNQSLLPARYAEFIRGWGHYLAVHSDSAELHLRRAVQLAPGWSEAWMALGEVYYHLLPDRASVDSLAESAFAESHRLDPDFTPARYHLTEMALARGDLAQARELSTVFRRSSRDSATSAALQLALWCAGDDLDAAGWRAAATRDYTEVLAAATILAPAPSFGDCATGGYQAMLAVDTASEIYRANALFALHLLQVSQGRDSAVKALTRSEEGRHYHLEYFYLLESAAGVGFEREAAALVGEQGDDFARMSSPLLWGRGTWEAHRGDPKAAAAIAAILDARADSSGARRERLFADVVAAHAALAARDTAAAVRRLSLLRPGGSLQEIAWSLADPIGFERLTLAEILLARGRYDDAMRVASLLDSPAPFVYLLYRPRSLAIRLEAARALGEGDLARTYESRLQRYRRSDTRQQGGAT